MSWIGLDWVEVGWDLTFWFRHFTQRSRLGFVSSSDCLDLSILCKIFICLLLSFSIPLLFNSFYSFPLQNWQQQLVNCHFLLLYFLYCTYPNFIFIFTFLINYNGPCQLSSTIYLSKCNFCWVFFSFLQKRVFWSLDLRRFD